MKDDFVASETILYLMEEQYSKMKGVEALHFL